MSQFNFGAGRVFMIPPASFADQTPVRFATIQEFQADLSSSIKMAYGANQYAEAAANAEGKITGKIKLLQVDARMLSYLLPGAVKTPGSSIEVDETGTVTAGAVTVTGSATYKDDLGVYAADGTPYAKVASAPTGQQYTVAAGVYGFNTTENTHVLTFRYSKSQAGVGSTVAVGNNPMGLATAFVVDAFNAASSNAGKTFGIKVFAAVFTKVSLPLKNNDFTSLDVEFEGLDNGVGQVYELYGV